jgi:hypothetical protein
MVLIKGREESHTSIPLIPKIHRARQGVKEGSGFFFSLEEYLADVLNSNPVSVIYFPF